MKLTKSKLKQMIKEEMKALNETQYEHAGESCNAAHPGLEHEEWKRKTYNESKETLKEVDYDKVQVPANVRRWLPKFINALKDAKLTRIKQVSILYKVIEALNISPQELMMYIQKIKRGMD